MQQLQMLTHAPDSSEGCAAEILETVPAVMRFIRAQMRHHRGPELSVPHFRTLLYLGRHDGASLSALAEFLGLSLPAASRMVEGLVRKRFVVRRIPPGNRRLIALALSARGRRTVATARQATERRLAEVVASIPPGERAAIQRALRALRERFQADHALTPSLAKEGNGAGPSPDPLLSQGGGSGRPAPDPFLNLGGESLVKDRS